MALLLAACQPGLTGAVAGESTGDDTGGTHVGSSFSTAAPDPATSEAGDALGDTSGSARPGTTSEAATDTGGESTSSGAVEDTSGLDAETTAGEPACDRALMVTGDTNVASNVDTPLYERLVALGFTVTVVDKVASTPADVGDNCVVIVSDIGSSADVNTKFRDAPVGVVVLETGLYDDMALVATGSELWWGDGYDDIAIVDSAHPLATGLSGTVSIYDGGGRGSWGVAGANADVVAVWPEDSTRATLFGYDTGVEMTQSFVAPARRVAFPGGVASVPMTMERIDLFEAAVKWAAGDLP